MANPGEVLKTKFDPTVPSFVLTNTIDPGHLDADDFIINDIALRIPPTNIQIDKMELSGNNPLVYQTLRTRQSRKIKSGYNQVRVSFSIVFKISNPIDQENFNRLIAGLRATPFCVVYNKYLDQMIGKPDDAHPIMGSEDSSRDNFKPIMLAWSSMSFSTLGHVNMPDCIEGVFDFLWFNYLPFTNMIAFKAGEDYSRPGYPWESALWRAFYQPFLLEQKPVNFPHQVNDLASRWTRFRWREFTLLAKGDPTALDASVKILNALKRQPSEVAKEMSQIIKDATNKDTPNPQLLNEGALDVLYRRLISNNILSPSDAYSDHLQQSIASSYIPQGSITNASGEIIAPLIKRLSGQSFISKQDYSDIDQAIILLSQRAQKLREVGNQTNVFGSGTQVNEYNYTKLLDTDAKVKGISTGGLELYGRKRNLDIFNGPQYNGKPSPCLIEAITVSFQNTLAIIPLTGYHYPTIQHVGSIDATVEFSINATNESASDFNKMYDVIDTMTLRYKQIPSGFTNLSITNDFLSCFGLKEFLVSGIRTTNIPNQPGRSYVNLTLTEAGITSQTKLDDPEQIVQEFVSGDIGLFKKIWDIIWRNSAQKEGFTGSVSAGNILTGLFSNSRKDVQQPTQVGYYERKVENVANSTHTTAFRSLCSAALVAYNKFLNNIHKTVGTGQTKNIHYLAVMDLQEFDSVWGFIPGIAAIKKTIGKRAAAFPKYNSVNHKKDTFAKRLEQGMKAQLEYGKKVTPFRTNKVLKQSLAAEQKAKEYTTQKLNTNTAYLVDAKKKALQNIGLPTYLQAVRKVFNDVLTKYKHLEEFESILQLKKELGLSKGIFAYPDFKQQIGSVAGFVEGVSTVNNVQLMKYEPDCYFWYPLYNGGGKSDTYNLIDQYYINEAQRHSTNIAQTAQGSLDSFFQETYRTLLDNQANLAPLKALDAKGGTELSKSFYSDSGTIVNSSKSEQLTVTVVPDSSSKVPTNWYDSEAPRICSLNTVSHSTDMNVLWGKIPFGPSQSLTAPPSTSSRPKGSATNSKIIEQLSPRLRGVNKWPKLGELRIEVQPEFEAILDELQAQGFYPKISNAYRTAAQQLEKVAQGSAMPGATNPGTHNWGLAADIISNQKGGGWVFSLENAKFYAALTMAATKRGFTSGGTWFGKGGTRKNPTHKSGWNKWGIGWDPAHTEYPSRKFQKAWTKDIMRERSGQNAQRYIPPSYVQERLKQKQAQPVGSDVASTVSSPLGQAINEFERDLYNGQAQTLMRAYPTFKLYFIEDDSNEGKRFAFDDFFSYNAVQSIRVVRDRNIAADLCEIYLTNVSGILSNRKFRQQSHSDQPRTKSGLGKENPSPMNADTKNENPIASLLLQEGINIHLKLGYSSDPDRLETAFTGVITDIQFTESDDLVRVVAQSYAIELIQDMKGLDKAKSASLWGLFGWTFWGFKQGASTGRILEEMMAQPEVLHFGRWKRNSGQGKTFGRELLTQRWSYEPEPQDDNIFAPSPQQDLGLTDDTFFQKLSYIIYRTTIWDIFQEMTLRHPNYIASVVPYQSETGERATMFFGLPNQLYFARHPSIDEQLKDARMERERETVEKKILNDKFGQKKKAYTHIIKSMPGVIKIKKNQVEPSQKELVIDQMLSKKIKTANSPSAVKNAVSNYFRATRLNLAKEDGWIKPFRSYHLITSAQHIVLNNIQATARNIANTIVIKYAYKANVKQFPFLGPLSPDVALQGNEEQFTLKLDNALPTEDVRTQIGQFLNVPNQELAKRYALGLLMRNVKEIYQGEIVIIGNPKVKPNDVIFLLDEYNDMTGAFEVRQVQHIFDQEHGFVTEIQPDMLVQAAEWSLLGSAEALGVVMEGFLHQTVSSKGPAASGGIGKSLSFLPWILGHGINLFGGFLANKIINYTQLAQPLVMSPLMHHGRPFTGGIPTRKITSSIWNTTLGTWTAEVSSEASSWIEDKIDELTGLIKTSTFQNSVGDFWRNDDGYPE